jgi:outer membrane protein assembly factor BamB
MSERDPFEQLGDLIDQPVEPRAAFAAELRSRLMSDMSASEYSREEQRASMEAVITGRPPMAIPIERPRRIRPIAILELAAVAVVVLGLVAALSRGWFGNDPETPTSVPAVALQGDGTPTPEQTPVQEVPTEQVPALIPTEAPGPAQIPTEAPNSAQILSEAGAAFPNAIWTLPQSESESVDFGGMLVEDGVVYRLLATTSLTGIQAVDSKTGAVKWQQEYDWAGTLFAFEDDVIFIDGGGNTLIAVDAETGQLRWRTQLDGNPASLTAEDDRVFVLADSDTVSALDELTGEQLWTVQPSASEGWVGWAPYLTGPWIAVESGTVAAISRGGVLTGFDVSTGETRWSHEGYQSGQVTLYEEDDRFVVVEGAGIGPGIGAETGVVEAQAEASPEAGSSEASNQQTDAVPAEAGVSGGANAIAVSTGECGDLFQQPGNAGASAGGSMSGTPEAGVSTVSEPSSGTVAVAATGIRVQAIDPASGEILWEQQTVSDGVSITAQSGDAAGSVVAVCAVDLEQGNVTSIDVPGSPSAGVMSIEDGMLTIGAIAGGGFVPAVAADEEGLSVVAASTIDLGNQAAIAAASDDSGVYLQLVDGSLVKVAAGHVDDDDHHEDRDDDPDDTPETEDD